MTKKLYLLLLPLLVFITGINYRADNNVFSKTVAGGYSISESSQGHFVHTSNLGKQSNQKIKHAIRIKAWDGSAAIVFSADWQPVLVKIYYIRPVCFYHTGPTLSSRFSLYNLRGPPTA